MMKTLRVTLADLEGIPHGSAPGATSAEVTAAYTGVVALTDGTLIPNAIKGKTVGGTGIVNFSVYPSDSPDVREEYHGFGVTVTAKIQSFDGTVVTARRTVIVPDSSPSTVHLGNLAPADPLPPQWVTVGDLVGDIEAAAGTAEWTGITDKPESFPPSAHAANHATGGSDPITPAGIGAQPALSGSIPYINQLGTQATAPYTAATFSFMFAFALNDQNIGLERAYNKVTGLLVRSGIQTLTNPTTIPVDGPARLDLVFTEPTTVAFATPHYLANPSVSSAQAPGVTNLVLSIEGYEHVTWSGVVVRGTPDQSGVVWASALWRHRDSTWYLLCEQDPSQGGVGP